MARVVSVVVESILLLYADGADAVARAVTSQAPRLGAELIAISLDELVRDVEFGDRWRWRGRVIDPTRTAVVNRLTSLGEDGARPGLESHVARQDVWRALHGELRRFAYVSSMPAATSVIGCYGSLLDQWSDLPELVPGLRVPQHARRGGERSLQGDVHAIANPWQLYTLGRRPADDPQTAAHAQLWYVRPQGWLVHVAQVGGLAMFVNAPPTAAPIRPVWSWIRSNSSWRE